MKNRKNEIIELLRQTGRVSVDELAEQFGVSAQTIRKDLNELNDKQHLRRVHGGAVMTTDTENFGYGARRAIAAAEKAGIGAAVARLIPDGSSLFVNIGTTTEACAKALTRHKTIMAITNSLNVATQLRDCPQIEVIISGGIMRHSDGGIVGEAAVDFIRQFRVDYAIISTSSIDEDGLLMDFDFREIRVTQVIIENARHVILAADASKFERKAPIRIGHISQVHTFVTGCCSEPIRQLCLESGVHLIETDYANPAFTNF